MRSKYNTIKTSTIGDSLGNTYPDVMTFPINKFKYSSIPLKVFLSTADITRFDIFTYNYYGTADYTDIILWLNNKASYHDLVEGDEFILPDIGDINRFYLDYLA